MGEEGAVVLEQSDELQGAKRSRRPGHHAATVTADQNRRDRRHHLVDEVVGGQRPEQAGPTFGQDAGQSSLPQQVERRRKVDRRLAGNHDVGHLA